MKTLKLLVLGMLLSSSSIAQEFKYCNLKIGDPVELKIETTTLIDFIGIKENNLYSYVIQKTVDNVYFTIRRHDLNGKVLLESSFQKEAKNKVVGNINAFLLEDKILFSYTEKDQYGVIKNQKTIPYFFAVLYEKLKIVETKETLRSLFPDVSDSETISFANLSEDRSKIVVFSELPTSTKLNLKVHAYDLVGQKLWSQTLNADIARNQITFDKVRYKNNGDVLIQLNQYPIHQGKLMESKANCTNLLFSILKNGKEAFQNDLTFNEQTFICDYTVNTDNQGNVVCIGFYRSQPFLKNPYNLGDFPNTQAEGIWYRKFDQKGKIVDKNKMEFNEKNFNVNFTEKDWETIHSGQKKNKWPGIDMVSLDLRFDKNNTAYFVSRFNPKSLKVEKFLLTLDVVVFQFSQDGKMNWSTSVYNKNESNKVDHSIFNFVLNEKGLHIICPTWLKKYPNEEEASPHNAFIVATVNESGKTEYESVIKYHRYLVGVVTDKVLMVDEHILYFYRYEEKGNALRYYKMEF